MKKAGFAWLQEKLDIREFQLTHESYIGTVDKSEISSSGTVIRTFKSKYDVKEETTMSHIEFALKYDDINLAFIKEVFTSIEHQTVEKYIQSRPNRKYPRIIGYLYEFSGGSSIDVNITTTNYEDVLDSSKYITGDIKKISKWKVNDNLLGTNEFCPVIRRTTELNELIDWNIEEAIENLEREYPPEIFKRASYYLYKKETKSSSKIENEDPPPDRVEKFIALLEEAGQKSYEETLSEHELVRIQNTIVEPRYADKRYRNFQNYVGQTMRDYSLKIHYVCPPPQFVKSLMNGIVNLDKKTRSVDSIIKAAIVSFGFVYIHPFEDGNGRIHRFLIHDILVREGTIPKGTILPFSAQILANIYDYEKILELISKPITRKVKYELNEAGKLSVINPLEIENLYRFPDLTSHTIFLARVLKTTINEDVPKELMFLQCYDELKAGIQRIVDMPDNRMDRMIIFLHQNRGKLAKRKRKFYPELSNTEISQMEEVYAEVFSKY